MTFTASDAHSAERVIVVGDLDPVVAPYAIVLDVDGEVTLAEVRQWLEQHVLFDTVACSVFVHPNASLVGECVLRMVEEHYAQARINANTVIARNESQGINVVRNLKRIASGDGHNALTTLPSMRGQTAVVCGAGPSLDDAYESLELYQGPVICVNTSAGAMLKAWDHGSCVLPSLIVCSESKQLDEWKTPDIIGCPYEIPVAMDLMSHPTHGGDSRVGPALYFASADPSLSYVSRLLNTQPIGYGPSCTTAAVSLCLALGAEKVLLVGQDCAFRGDRMYAEGTPYAGTRVEFDGQGRATITKPTKGVQQADVVSVEGVDGKPVQTMPSMLSFAHWFAGQPESIRKRVINCSTHGVKLQGIEHRPLGECIQSDGEYSTELTAGTDDFSGRAGYALHVLRNVLRRVPSSSDAELVERAHDIGLMNFWTNPAKLRYKLENASSNATAYGHAIAAAVRKAHDELMQELG